MTCCAFIGNKPPSGGDPGGGGGIPQVFSRATKTDSAQTVNNDTETTITFNNADYNEGGLWIPSTNIRPPVDGLYLLKTCIDITFQAAGTCRIWIDLAGSGAVAEEAFPVAGAGLYRVNLSDVIYLAQFTLMSVRVRQVTTNTASVATGLTRFSGAQLWAGTIGGG